jgi:hypothetical protein
VVLDRYGVGRCFTDRRDPRYVEHSVETLVGQRVFALALGYEDLNDHDGLRKDPVFAVSPASSNRSCGRTGPLLPARERSIVWSTPKRDGAKYHKVDCNGEDVDGLFVYPWNRISGRRGRTRGPLLMAITTTTAICRCTCFAVETYCFQDCAARISTPGQDASAQAVVSDASYWRTNRTSSTRFI